MNTAFDRLKDVFSEQSAVAEPEFKEVVLPQRDAQGRAYGTGRRKESVARVWVRVGSGKFLVNREKTVMEYFNDAAFEHRILEPFSVLGVLGKYDVWCTVSGGGISGQAGALRHGISRALLAYNPLYRAILKQERFLTRDPRMVERKKIGHKKARRSPQFSKR